MYSNWWNSFFYFLENKNFYFLLIKIIIFYFLENFVVAPCVTATYTAVVSAQTEKVKERWY